MDGRRKAAAGPAAEAVGLRINEGPRRPRSLPFTATYLGDGVVSLPGVGVFARFTRAEVDAATAARLEGDPAWEVRARVTRPAPDAPGGGG